MGSGVRLVLAAVAAGLMAIAVFNAAAAQDSAQPARPSFEEWLAAFRADALAQGLDPSLLDRALTGLKPLERVVENDRRQAELVLTFEMYLKRTLTPETIAQARSARAEHGDLLHQVSEQYGVPPGIIVAIWGMESRFGRNSGRTPTRIQALATLAWDGRRAAFFRQELLHALRMVNDGRVELGRLRGSWAGAMGQPQFMPSSYLHFAQDFDGDGREDIWSSTADVFASIANYLAKNGWTRGVEWGREVAVTATQLRRVRRTVPYRAAGCYAVRDTTQGRQTDEWRRLGVRRRNGGPLPDSDLPLSLVTAGARSFLVTANYFALLRYNCAHHYALTAALLSAEAMGTDTPAARRPAR